MQPLSNILSHFVLQAVSERLELAPAGGRSEPQVSTVRDFVLPFFPQSSLFRENTAKLYTLRKFVVYNSLLAFVQETDFIYLIIYLSI